MEKLEVFDKQGQPTGIIKSREEIHRGGNWHRGVHVWILNSNKELLIQKRSAQKDSHPNEWDISVAGHILAGHSNIQSALKELEEELGLTVSKENFKYLFTYKQSSVLNNNTFFNNEIDDVYLIKKDLDISRINLQKEEVAEIKFIPWQDLEKKIKTKDPAFVPHDEEYKKLFEYLVEK